MSGLIAARTQEGIGGGSFGSNRLGWSGGDDTTCATSLAPITIFSMEPAILTKSKAAHYSIVAVNLQLPLGTRLETGAVVPTGAIRGIRLGVGCGCNVTESPTSRGATPERSRRTARLERHRPLV